MYENCSVCWAKLFKAPFFKFVRKIDISNCCLLSNIFIRSKGFLIIPFWKVQGLVYRERARARGGTKNLIQTLACSWNHRSVSFVIFFHVRSCVVNFVAISFVISRFHFWSASNSHLLLSGIVRFFPEWM